MEYIPKSKGPLIGAEYKVILKVTPTINFSKKGRLLGRITGYDKELIYIEASIYNFYAKIESESVATLFMNRFGKVVIPLGTEVYVLPKDSSDAMSINSKEVNIIKIKD